MKAKLCEEYNGIPANSILKIEKEITEDGIAYYQCLHAVGPTTGYVEVPCNICIEFDEDTEYYDHISGEIKKIPKATEQQKSIYYSPYTERDVLKKENEMMRETLEKISQQPVDYDKTAQVMKKLAKYTLMELELK